MKPLNYILISAAFMLSACASGQYSSSEDGIYFNPDKRNVYPAPASSPAMAKTKHLNEKTQSVVTTRMESPANQRQQVDTLYVTNESRTVEIDAEPDKTYLIVDESDSYARRLRMFEEEEYTPPTVNVNIGAGYGYGYDWPYYSSWYSPGWGFGRYHSPWYWGSSWIGYNYWDPWYYPGYYSPGYYSPWYYGGYYGYHYPHHHYHYDYSYGHNRDVHYGRRVANAGTVRHASSVGNSRSNANATNSARRTTHAQPQIQQVRGSSVQQNSGNTGSTVGSRRRSASPASNNTSTSLQQNNTQQNTGDNGNTAVTSRRRSNTSTGTQSTNYTRQTTTPTYNNSTQNATSSRRRTTSATTPSNRSNSAPAAQYNNTPSYHNSTPASSNSSSQINNSRRSSGGSSGNSGSSGSSGNSSGTSRRR